MSSKFVTAFGMRILLLGCGLMGAAVASDLAESPGVSDVLVCDRDLEKAKELADRQRNGKFSATSCDVTDNDGLVRTI